MFMDTFVIPVHLAGDSAILNDGDESGTHKSSIYIPWLRKTKYLAVESVVQRRPEHTGQYPCFCLLLSSFEAHLLFSWPCASGSYRA
jgi:hypothetical protein